VKGGLIKHLVGAGICFSGALMVVLPVLNEENPECFETVITELWF
jgi:hypothetical protein